jgi:endonuclease YncB( thermonuclease family)
VTDVSTYWGHMMSEVEPLEPGPVRRWWWQTSQRVRLVVLGCLTVAAMALTGLVLLPLPHGSATDAADDLAGSSATPLDAGKFAVTVTAVPAVDVVHGQDVAGRQLVIEVPGIAAGPDCWAADARTAAEKLLRGKQIRLPRQPEGSRVVAPVSLPDGRDYARIAVSRGLAGTDARQPAPNQRDLVAEETRMRQAALGVWAPCPTTAPTTTAPTTSDSAGTGGPGGTEERPGTTDRPAPGTATEPPPPPDDAQRGVALGAPCAPEGARGVTADGKEVVCRSPGGSPPKWMKA